jgi:hypothetical protein
VSELLFVVRLSGHDAFDDVIGDVTASVLQQVGCGPATAGDFVEELKHAVMPRLARGVELDVQFHIHPGSCDVVVVLVDERREVWRVTRRAP